MEQAPTIDSNVELWVCAMERGDEGQRNGYLSHFILLNQYEGEESS